MITKSTNERIVPKSYFQEYKKAEIRAGMLADHLERAEQKYIDLMVRLESLSIKWNKRGKSLTTWDEALEELNEEYIA